MAQEMLRLQLGGYEGVVGVQNKVEMFFVGHATPSSRGIAAL